MTSLTPYIHPHHSSILHTVIHLLEHLPLISNWQAATLISQRSLRWYVQRNFLRSNILLMCTWLPLISHSLTALLPWCQPTHRTKPTQLARKRPANLSDTYWSHRNNISGFTLHLLNVLILNKSLSPALFGIIIPPSLLVSPPLLSYDTMTLKHQLAVGVRARRTAVDRVKGK